MMTSRLPIRLAEFNNVVKPLWYATPRLGIAVSGGPDSMALAYLTHLYAQRNEKPIDVHAFIVDHGARSTSAAEADQTATFMDKLGIRPHVLKVNWEASSAEKDIMSEKEEKGAVPKAAFETHARVARYRALGTAMLKAEVNRLLLAHHEDDQAETVMMRLLTGSSALGLAGMAQVAKMPCVGDMIGGDDILLGRPLLGFPKSRLIDTCNEFNLPYIDDHTNHDPTYTRRNAVRQLLSHNLPRALSKPALLEMQQRSASWTNFINEEASKIIDDVAKPYLNARLGCLDFTLPHFPKKPTGVEEKVILKVLSRLVTTVNPNAHGSLRDMRALFETICGPLRLTKELNRTTSGLIWMGHLKLAQWHLERQPYPSALRDSFTKTLTTRGTERSEVVYVDRWFIQVQYDGVPDVEQKFICRPMTKDDLALVKIILKARELMPQFDQLTRDREGRGRLKIRHRNAWTCIPILKLVEDDGAERIVGLPTLAMVFDPKVKFICKFRWNGWAPVAERDPTLEARVEESVYESVSDKIPRVNPELEFFKGMNSPHLRRLDRMKVKEG